MGVRLSLVNPPRWRFRCRAKATADKGVRNRSALKKRARRPASAESDGLPLQHPRAGAGSGILKNRPWGRLTKGSQQTEPAQARVSLPTKKCHDIV